MIVSSFTFQATGFYERHGYVEVGRTVGLPVAGMADVHFRELLDDPAPGDATVAPRPLVTFGPARGTRHVHLPGVPPGAGAVAGDVRGGPGHGDTQEPHSTDEVYVVVAGSAVLVVAGEHTPVSRGWVAYAPTGVPHRFVDVSEDLRVVVVFAPPED